MLGFAPPTLLKPIMCMRRSNRAGNGGIYSQSLQKKPRRDRENPGLPPGRGPPGASCVLLSQENIETI